MVAATRGVRGIRLVVSASSAFTLGVVALAVGLVLGWQLYLLGLAIFVPTAVWVYRRPQRGLLVLAALLPFQGLLIITGTPDWVKAWKEAWVVLLLVLTLVCPPEARGSPDRRLPPWVPALGGLFALALVSAFFVDPVTAYTGMRISFVNVLVALVAWRCPLSRKEIDRLVTIFMVVAAITSVVGIWQQVVGHAYLANLGYPYNDTIFFTEGFRLRSFSTFNQPFPFAFYLMLTVLLATPFALSEPNRLRSRLYFLSLPLLASGLLFSYVRGAYLGLGIGLLYLAFHRYKLLVYGIPLAIVALLFLPTGTSFSSALFHTNTLGARTTGWEQRWQVLRDDPLGSGIGTTGAAAEKAAKLQRQGQGQSQQTYQPDNSYLKVGFELGLPGLWLFVAMLVSMFLYARATERRTTGLESHFAAAVSGQLLAIMAGSTVATYFEMVPMDGLFWLMMGVVATLAPLTKPGPAVHVGANPQVASAPSTLVSPATAR